MQYRVFAGAGFRAYLMVPDFGSGTAPQFRQAGAEDYEYMCLSMWTLL